jgi:hypothetical protein
VSEQVLRLLMGAWRSAINAYSHGVQGLLYLCRRVVSVNSSLNVIIYLAKHGFLRFSGSLSKMLRFYKQVDKTSFSEKTLPFSR